MLALTAFYSLANGVTNASKESTGEAFGTQRPSLEKVHVLGEEDGHFDYRLSDKFKLIIKIYF